MLAMPRSTIGPSNEGELRLVEVGRSQSNLNDAKD